MTNKNHSPRTLHKDVKEVLEVLERQNKQDTFEYERALIFDWVRDHKAKLRLTSRIKPHDFGHDAVTELERRGYDLSQPTSSSSQPQTSTEKALAFLKRFAHDDYSNFSLSDIIIRELFDCIHRLPSVTKDAELIASWNIRTHAIKKRFFRFRDIFSKDLKPLDYSDSDLKGDYIIFRPTPGGNFTLAFARFYGHKSGGTRFMGLKIDDQHNFLSSKGWVSKHSEGYQITNYIIERGESPHFKYTGGASSFWLLSPRGINSTKIVRHDGEIAMTVGLHWLSINNELPSCAKVLFCRVKGYETLGGSAGETPDTRTAKSRKLQQLLYSKFQGAFNEGKTFAFLSQYTPVKAHDLRKFFYSNNTSDLLPTTISNQTVNLGRELNGGFSGLTNQQLHNLEQTARMDQV